MDRVETKMPLAIDFELDKVNAQAKYVTVLYFASRHGDSAVREVLGDNPKINVTLPHVSIN
jgi:hypothetical protein